MIPLVRDLFEVRVCKAALRFREIVENGSFVTSSNARSTLLVEKVTKMDLGGSLGVGSFVLAGSLDWAVLRSSREIGISS